MSVGPFYCVYLRPRWRLFAIAADSESETLGHPSFWRLLCNEVIAPHYRIRNKKSLSELCYGMPRGRCAQALSRRGKAMQAWTIYHGGDFPSTKSVVGSDAILAVFKLKKANVKFMFDVHETMQADDQVWIQQIIGPVPYSKRKST